MKTKIIYFTTLLLMIFYAQQIEAQEVIMSLDTYTIYASDEDSSIPDDITYIKDVNHRLDPYIGTFVGTHQGKTITFEITSITKQGRILRDKLNIKYKIQDSTGAVIAQSMNLLDDSYDISGNRFNSQGFYMATYVGFDGCAQAGTFYLQLFNSSNQLTLIQNELKVYMDQAREIVLLEECPNGPSPHVFPANEQFVLNRV